MNTRVSSQESPQKQSAVQTDPIGGFEYDPNGGGEWTPSPQFMQKLHDATNANDLNGFNALLRQAHDTRNEAIRRRDTGHPESPDAAQNSAAEQQQRLAAAMANLQQAAPGVAAANGAQAMPGGPRLGMNAANPMARTAPPFMPERLDSFESFLGNFISALGEGMSVQQAARTMLRDLRAQQMLHAHLAFQAQQAQQQALAAQAAQAQQAMHRAALAGGIQPFPQVATNGQGPQAVPSQVQPGQQGEMRHKRRQQILRHLQVKRHLEDHHTMRAAMHHLMMDKYQMMERYRNGKR